MSEPRSIQSNVQSEPPASSAGHTTTTSSAERGLLFYITAPWAEILKSIVPVGYQDDEGFHYGETSETDKIAT